MIAFSIPFTVQPKQADRSRFVPRGANGRGFVQHYQSKEVVTNHRNLAALVAEHRPAEPFDEPMSLTLVFVAPYLKGHNPKARERLVFIPRDSKPDLDNCEKQILDVLERSGFVSNDARIVRKNSIKVFGPQSQIVVILEPLTHVELVRSVSGALEMVK